MSADVIRGPWPDDEARARQRHPAGRVRRSPAWAYASRPSGVHCQICDRVFAAGHVPADGELVCRDCRQERAGSDDPTLFDEGRP